MQESREKKYPFKFLDSYNRNDTDIFFGRDEEIKVLYEIVSQNPMVLVYGPSGTGKTSLIQCGLAGKFKSYDWLPVTVRREGDINVSLEKSLVDNGGNAENFDAELEDASENELNSLAKLVKGVYLSNFKTTYFIFDQFEELYILGNKDEEDRFITAIKDIRATGQPVKFIFSIREEYLGYLYRFEKVFPQLLRKKLRVEPMTNENLKDILTGINNLKNTSIRVDGKELNDISEAIFEKLRGDSKTLHFELPYLQVLMDKLYLDITKDKDYKTDAFITLDLVNKIDNLGNVLKKFLEDQVEQVRVLAVEKNICANNISGGSIWKILSPFASLEGTKDPILKDEIKRRIYDKDIDDSLVSFCIDEFVNRRILNFSHETELYELAHDSLAKCIAGKRSDVDIRLLEIYRLIKYQASIKEGAREFFSEKQLKIISPYLSNLKLSDDESELVSESQKEVAITISKRKRNRYLALTITIFVIAFFAWLLYYKNQQGADNIRKVKLARLKEQISTSTGNEQKLLPFFYILEALDLEKDLSEYKKLIETAKRWKTYPTHTLEKIFVDSSFKIGGAAFVQGDSLIYVWDYNGKNLKAWDYNGGKILWSISVELRDRKSDNPLVTQRKLFFFSRQGLKTNEKRDSLNISDSSLFFVKMYIDSVVNNWDVTGLPVLPKIINKIYGASFSHDKQNVMTWGKNSESNYDAANVWNSEGPNIGTALVHDGIKGSAFSPDDKFVLTWDDSTARVWRYTNDSAIFRLPSNLFKLRSQVETGLELSPSDNSTLRIIPLPEYNKRREEYVKLYNEYLEKERKK
ncbi:ATP-binding protein [Segetibacter aerophilus]|uniref:Novel STAND NTPase 1 domain-containing protein n=1 Tax=Segetibacter aerophilus TaxID=670293 RepID=A0A512BGR5_9BACT|nr:ATP-binding protein [Segetibacter aerophilus]GEO11161.1 hypothetical protein SAE01_36570 [Segetibacter aerophilus]